MPSLSHDFPLTLLRARPALVPQLVARLSEVELPPHRDVRIEDSDLSQWKPVQLRADLVLTTRDARGRPAAGFIVESQLRRRGIKRITWPLYAMIERARLRCPIYVLVMTRDAAVARWAAEPIDIGPYGSTYRCIVIGPDAIPRIRSVEQARAAPELAILSAVHHGNDPDGAEIVYAAMEATETLDDEDRRFYDSAMWSALNAAARELLQEMMNMRDKFKLLPPDNPMSRIRELMRFERLQEQERLEGSLQGRAESLLAVLHARRLRVTQKMRERILTCQDVPTLDRWIHRAAVVAKASEVFRPTER